MHIFRPDEIADIWIRRIIKAIRLQLNYFGGRGVHFVNVKRGGSQGQVLSVEEEVCVCVCVSDSDRKSVYAAGHSISHLRFEYLL